MLEPEEKDDMPDDKNSSPLRGGDDEMHKPGDEGDSDSYFFDAGEGAAIDDRVSFCAVPKSEQSGQYGRRYGRAHDTWSNKFPHLRNNNAARSQSLTYTWTTRNGLIQRRYTRHLPMTRWFSSPARPRLASERQLR